MEGVVPGDADFLEPEIREIKKINRGGPRAGAGRPKGVPNKIPADVKAMILGALDARGGQKWLEKQMNDNPVAFMSLIGKILPMTVQGDPDNPLEMVARIELVGVRSDNSQD